MPDLNTLRQLVTDVGPDTAQRLLGVFKDDVEKRIAVVSDLIDNGNDLDNLRRQAHSLKGLCSTYGALTGEKIAEELQDACDMGDQGTITAKAKAALNIIPSDVNATLEAAKKLTT
ncbi:MAG: Hpt domain-containing protein [Magnetovibrio sp.]|nr:Hpt domain-containing protein [Magnetovibrio sp.]